LRNLAFACDQLVEIAETLLFAFAAFLRKLAPARQLLALALPGFSLLAPRLLDRQRRSSSANAVKQGFESLRLAIRPLAADAVAPAVREVKVHREGRPRPQGMLVRMLADLARNHTLWHCICHTI
jgi:hypothetical protein